MFFRWKEIYVTFSLQEQIEIRKILETNNIPVRIKYNSFNARVTDNLPLGANPVTSNTAGMNPSYSTEYRIFVKRNDAEEARKLIYG